MTDIERISDPARMRALAHPLRLRLLDALTIHDELTATQCAELTGESVASCSAHLRMLAKYGFIELGTQRGREKPWRLTDVPMQLQPDHDAPGSVAAAAGVAAQVIAHETARLQAYFRGLAASGAARDESNSSTLVVNVSWMTDDELADAARTLHELAERFAERSPTSRPTGSRPVRLFAALTTDAATTAAAG